MQKFKELQIETTRGVSDGPLSATLMSVTGASAAFPSRSDVILVGSVGVWGAVAGGIAGGPPGAVLGGLVGVSVGAITVGAVNGVRNPGGVGTGEGGGVGGPAGGFDPGPGNMPQM